MPSRSSLFRKSVAGLFAGVVVIGAAEYVMDRSNSPVEPRVWDGLALVRFRADCRTASLAVEGVTASVADSYCGCIADAVRDSFSPAEVKAWAKDGPPVELTNRCSESAE